MPLHPVMVHLPLALALLMPVFVALATWGLWTGRLGRRAWLGIAALQLLLVGSALFAMKTGETEEDRVEAVVSKGAIHQHEEYAEQFTWGAAAVLALTLVVFAPVGRRGFALMTLVGAVAVAGLALRVGHAGGQLVYVHNAGAAYAAGSTQNAGAAGEKPDRTAAPVATRVSRGDDDDDDR